MSNQALIKAYLDKLPAERRTALEAVRKVIRANLSDGIEEGIQYGSIGYYVPHKVYPDGYHCDPKQPLPWGGLANRANGMTLYFFSLYGDAAEMARFQEAWKKSGKRLDMGKSCIRFKKLEDVPLDVIAKTTKRLTAKRFIKIYEESILTMNKQRAAKAAKKKAAAKKTTAKKTVKAGAKKTARKAAKKTTRKAVKKTTRAKTTKKAVKKTTKARKVTKAKR